LLEQGGLVASSARRRSNHDEARKIGRMAHRDAEPLNGQVEGGKRILTARFVALVGDASSGSVLETRNRENLAARTDPIPSVVLPESGKGEELHPLRDVMSSSATRADSNDDHDRPDL
jgi:hypothetical protein